MIKRFLAALAAGVAVTVGMAAPAGAQGPTDTRTVLRPGDGITFTSAQPAPGNCSIAAAGRDSAGRLIGLTAGHCTTKAGVNAPVYKMGEQGAGILGRLTPVYSPGSVGWLGLFVTNNKPDYGTILLDETKVRYEPTSEVDAEGQSVTITGTRGFTTTGSGNIGSVCSAGYTTKIHCSSDLDGILVRSNLINAYPRNELGDSGGALVDNTGKLLGVLTGKTVDYPPNASTRIDVIIADMDAKASYGAGWTPITS